MKTSCVIIGTVVGNSFGIVTMKIIKLSEEISILKVDQTIELPKRHKFEIGDTVGMTIENGRYRRILAVRCN